MNPFRYQQGRLYCDATPLDRIADAVGTPTYVYSASAIADVYQAYDRALSSLPHLVCYAVKANMNLAVLGLLARLGAGADVVSAGELYRRAAGLGGIEVVGVHMHIGSQLTKVTPVADSLLRLADLVEGLRADGIGLTYVDVGGGVGIRYHDETPPAPGEYVATLKPLLRRLQLTVLLEPGRSVVGNAGALLTR